MSQRFNTRNNSVDDLKSQINIVDQISRAVPLKKAGANYKGCCPFHNEKTPSFVVSEQKQIFTCFGCGASGDVIEFTKRFNNLDFREAVEKLAKENGIEIDLGKQSDNGKDTLYEINREAARFFYNTFTSGPNPGYAYMKKRNIDDGILKKFGIGYADAEWDSLYKHLKSKGYEDKMLLDLGLVSRSEKNGKYYDKFRNRVVFPIINTSGKVIGFGARRIDENDKPKYLNSSENLIFSKKNNLYALNTTKQDIGKEGYAVIVEGYMDVIGLYQHGVRNCTASLGTALTENQAKLIKRYTKNVVLSYDADNAGRAAALRGIDILSPAEIKVKVLHVTDGKDPDEFIKNNGKDAFIKLIDNALPMVEYKLQAQRIGLNLESDDDRIEYMKRGAAIIKGLSPVEQDIYIKKLSNELKIAEGVLRMEVSGTESIKKPVYRKPAEEESAVRSLSGLEANLLKSVLMSPTLTEQLLDNRDAVESELGCKIMNIMFELYGMKGDFDLSDITDRLDPEESLELKAAIENALIAGNEEKVFRDCINSYNRNTLLKREKELIDRLSLADYEDSGGAVTKLTAELMEVQKSIKNYGGRI